MFDQYECEFDLNDDVPDCCWTPDSMLEFIQRFAESAYVVDYTRNEKEGYAQTNIRFRPHQADYEYLPEMVDQTIMTAYRRV